MKISKVVKKTIGLKEFSEKLDYNFTSMKIEDSYLALRGEKPENIKVCLRCSDIKELFGIDINVFDKDDGVTVTKAGLTVDFQEELYKDSSSKFMRKWNSSLKKYLGLI